MAVISLVLSYCFVKDLRLVATTAIGPLVWGTTFVTTTQLLPPDRPLFVGAMRALPAGLLLCLLVAVLAGSLALPRGVWWRRAALLGTLNIGLFFPLLFLAAYRLPGGVAAMIGAIGPFVVAGYAYLLLGDRPTRRLMLAAGIGVLGIALLVLRSTIVLDPVGLLAAAAGAFIMGLGTVLGRKWGLPEGYKTRTTALLALTGWQLTFGGLLILAASFVIEGAPPALTTANLAGFAYLTLVGTVLAYLLWFRGVANLAPTRNTLLTLLSPTMATVLGWALLGEALSFGQLLGVAAVLGAVVVGTSGPGPAPRPAVVRPLAPVRRRPKPGECREVCDPLAS